MSEPAPTNADPQDIRPVIPRGAQSNWGMWAFFALLAVGGVVLFNALNATQEQPELPSTAPAQSTRDQRIVSPQPLQVPERFQARANGPDATERDQVPVVRETPIVRRPPPIVTLPPIEPELARREPVPVNDDPVQDQGPQVVYEQTGTRRVAAQNDEAPEQAARVTAARFQNPSRTIPQGTVIQAVLETALDSTRAGAVRALVQRDVSSFDGTRVLIPRGSRLYGEYEASLQRGQNRALVQWSRLIRPDGVTIALDSPSSDPLGRAGVKGEVDTKFLQRFGGAILQTVLDIGVGLAVNKAADGVIVALPGSTQNVPITEPDAIQPTLKVKHGTSVSVFVARDLDFSTVES